jgi:2,5-diketo-D-gluconate reductase A
MATTLESGPVVTLNDGHTIPQLGFGTAQISTSDIVTAVGMALEIGYRHIDTAAIYGNEAGVGKAIAESGVPRSEVFVTTKLWNSQHEYGKALRAARQSLDKLGLEYLDLYLIHWPTPQRDDYVEAWNALEELKHDGLTRSIGVSNFTARHLRRLEEECRITPTINQIELHPTFTQTALTALHTKMGIKTEAWSPLGLADDLTHGVIVGLAEHHHRTPAQIVLRWHLQKGFIVIPKSTTPARIAENFAIFDFELTPEDVAAIDACDTGNRIGDHPDKVN